MSASFPLTAAVLQHFCLHWVRATWATSTFYCQSGVGKINQNQWWKMFCFGFAVSKISTCVHKRKQNTELYFTELFWTSTNFCIHIVSIPPLIFLRVNCMAWLPASGYGISLRWRKLLEPGVVLFLFHNICQHMKQVLFCYLPSMQSSSSLKM